MNLNALYSSVIVGYPLKFSLSSDKSNVLKTSSIEDRGHLISGTIVISRSFCCFHPLQTDKIIVFDIKLLINIKISKLIENLNFESPQLISYPAHKC